MSSVRSTSSTLTKAIISNPLLFTPDAPLSAVIASISQRNFEASQRQSGQQVSGWASLATSCVLVMVNQQIAGICTTLDLVKLLANGQSPDHAAVSEVMSQPVTTWGIDQFTDIFATLQFMQAHHIHQLPILDRQGELMGLVTFQSLQQLLHLKNLLQLRQVHEVMASTVEQTTPEQSILAIARQMATHGASYVTVVEPMATGKVRPIGIITTQDIVQLQSLAVDLNQITATAVIGERPYCLQRHDTLWAAHQVMQSRRTCRVMITGEEGDLQGIVTQSCMLQILNPSKLHQTFDALQRRIADLEAEKVALLESRNQQLEEQVKARTLEINNRVEREAFLARVARQINQSLDLDTMLTSAVAEVRAFLSCDRVVVYQFEDDFRGLVVAESIHANWPVTLGQQYQDVCFPQWLEADYLTGQQRIVNDVYQAGLSDCHLDFLTSLDIKSYLIVPILIADRLWGLMVAHHCESPQPWQHKQIDLLDRLGIQLAIAIQQRQLYQQAQIEIQERQQAEIALQQEHDFTNAILNSTGALVVVSDCQGRIVQFNQTCQRVTGYSLAEVQGQKIWDCLVPSDETSWVETLITEVLQGRSLEEVEYCWVTKTDQRRLIAWSNATLTDSQGRVEYIIGTGIDVTETRQAETALRKSEATNRALLDTIPDLMIRMKADGTYLDFLPARDFKVIPHLTDLYGQSIYDVLPPAMAKERMGYIRQALATHVTQVYEYPIEIEGQWSYEEARIAVSGDDEVLLIIRDISERKRLEAERERSELALHGLVKGTAAVTGENFFEALVQQIVQSLQVSHALVTVCEGKQGRTIAFCADGELQPNIRYELQNLPCEITLEQQLYCCPSHLREAFPDSRLAFLEAESYLGLAMLDTNSQPLGTLCIFNRQPLTNRTQVENILKIFAARAAAELERQKTIDELHQLNQELEARVKARTKQLSDINLAVLDSSVALLESQERLRESEELLRLTIDNAPIGIVTTTLDGQFRTVNQAFCIMLGYSSDEMINHNFLALTHPDDRADSQLKIQQLITGEVNTCKLEKRYVHKNGSVIDAIVRVCKVQDPEGQPLQFVAEIEDISDRKQAEEQIKRQILAMDSAIDGIAVLRNDRFEYLNPSHASLFGYDSAEELIGQLWYQLYSESELKKFTQEVFPALQTAGHWQGEAIATRKDGSTFHEEVSLTLSSNGELICVCRDITERKQAEADIHKALEAERELNDLKTRFVSTTSHEFRTPLGVIASSAGIIQDYGDRLDDSKKQKHFKRIQDSVIHMTQLLEDVLTLSRVEAGRLQLKLTPTSIPTFCAEIIEEFATSDGNTRIRLEAASFFPDLVMMDQRLLRQILTNLLSNALKYSFPDSEVLLQLTYQSSSFALTIKDQGIGIPADDLKHLFQSFHRAKNVGNVPGTGLGLSIVKKLVELHQGKITFQSQINLGTTCTVRFPLRLVQSDPCFT